MKWMRCAAEQLHKARRMNTRHRASRQRQARAALNRPALSSTLPLPTSDRSKWRHAYTNGHPFCGAPPGSIPIEVTDLNGEAICRDCFLVGAQKAQRT